MLPSIYSHLQKCFLEPNQTNGDEKLDVSERVGKTGTNTWLELQSQSYSSTDIDGLKCLLVVSQIQKQPTAWAWQH